MTFQEALKREKKWPKRCIIINLYHNSMRLRKQTWTLRMTAKRLGISIGQVSEGIKLAKAILEDSKLEDMSRDDALRAIK